MFSVTLSDSSGPAVPEPFTPESLPINEFHSTSRFEDVSTEKGAHFRKPHEAKFHPPDLFNFRKYVPYQLVLQDAGLFPEFYYHFKKNFATESLENGAYCTRTIQDFAACYEGTRREIEVSVAKVEDSFDSTFRQCLHPALLAKYRDWKFTRACVETQFKQRLAETSDYVSYPLRLKKLVQRGEQHKDFEPLVDFLLAFDQPESVIWTHLIQAVLQDKPHSLHRSEVLNALVGKWKNETCSLSRKVKGFVSEFRESHESDFDAKSLLPLLGLPVAFLAFLGKFAKFGDFKLHISNNQSDGGDFVNGEGV